jgi:hypothetical protein
MNIRYLSSNCHAQSPACELILKKFVFLFDDICRDGRLARALIRPKHWGQIPPLPSPPLLSLLSLPLARVRRVPFPVALAAASP